MRPKFYLRRSMRLKNYDYTQSGAYFVTVCTHKHWHLFGDIIDSEMHLNQWGEIVAQEWTRTGILRRRVLELDAFVIMPNHFHGIIVLTNPSPTPAPQRQLGRPISNSLSTIVGAFKAAVTRQINRLQAKPDHPIWQINFYDHIIRSETELNNIRAYIENNPARWDSDSLFSRKVWI